MIHSATLERHGEINYEILAMVNEHSPLSRKLKIRDVSRANYCVIEHDGMVVACAKVEKVNWYQAEITHLVVRPEYRRQGFGRAVLRQVLSEAAELKARIAQCTIRPDNEASQGLFSSEGFKSLLQFTGLSGKAVMLWQKLL